MRVVQIQQHGMLMVSGGAAKCNTHSGSTTYGDGTDLRVAFAVNTSMLKFTVLNPYDVWGGPRRQQGRNADLHER